MIPANCSDCTTFLLGQDTTRCLNNTHPEDCKQKEIWADEVASAKPLSGRDANRLIFEEGLDAVEERGNKDDGHEVYRHDTLEMVRKCLKQVDEGDED